MTLPEDIIKNVTRENWEDLFDDFMVVAKTRGILGHENTVLEYVWEPSVMRDFIKAILK
jgi:hypothetical protein